jgi:hypothetical protein
MTNEDNVSPMIEISGNLDRMGDNRIPLQVYNYKAEGRRNVGRPRARCIDICAMGSGTVQWGHALMMMMTYALQDRYIRIWVSRKFLVWLYEYRLYRIHNQNILMYEVKE